MLSSNDVDDGPLLFFNEIGDRKHGYGVAHG